MPGTCHAECTFQSKGTPQVRRIKEVVSPISNLEHDRKACGHLVEKWDCELVGAEMTDAPHHMVDGEALHSTARSC